ncbi:uncharacterized protein LOC126846410 [Adelges cooleyi]|uniref:uncharacterized protein LOC126846410 n=1 Tax=Adelges cooleyi TaxID=133065 RepID=UPI00218075F0|nr:uncharacterized protein LOC126846410 [Adelges cooleyi]
MKLIFTQNNFNTWLSIVLTVLNLIATSLQQINNTKSILYPIPRSLSTINSHRNHIYNSFGVSGNVGIGLHFGGGYRIKTGDGNVNQEIVHNKMYDKYLGTSFGFGSASGFKKGHENDVEHGQIVNNQIIEQDQQDDGVQESDGEVLTTTTVKPKPGVFRKLTTYWSGEREDPKNNYSNGIIKWSVQQFKKKNPVGTPR